MLVIYELAICKNMYKFMFTFAYLAGLADNALHLINISL